jgi:hypothetical protein
MISRLSLFKLQFHSCYISRSFVFIQDAAAAAAASSSSLITARQYRDQLCARASDTDQFPSFN